MAKSTAQQKLPDTAKQGTSIIGLSIYGSDGSKLGEATQVGMHEGEETVAAQLEPSLMGVNVGKEVLFPAKMIAQNGDRLEVPLTAEQVKNQISKL